MKKEFNQIIKENRKLILKGGKFSIINKYSLKSRDYTSERFKDNPNDLTGFDEILSLTRPEIIGEIYERYVKAGVDLIVTNTLSCNRISLSKYELGDLTYEINLASAKLARSKISKYTLITWDKPRFVAGAVSNVPADTDFEFAESVFSEQIKALIAGKVDFIYFTDIENELSLKAALSAYSKLMVRRKKVGDLIISVKNYDLIDFLSEIDFADVYPGLDVLGVGCVFDLNDENMQASIDKVVNKFDALVCSFDNNEKELNLEGFSKDIQTIKNIEKVKILGFENNFLPDIFVDIMKMLE